MVTVIIVNTSKEPCCVLGALHIIIHFNLYNSYRSCYYPHVTEWGWELARGYAVVTWWSHIHTQDTDSRCSLNHTVTLPLNLLSAICWTNVFQVPIRIPAPHTRCAKCWGLCGTSVGPASMHLTIPWGQYISVGATTDPGTGPWCRNRRRKGNFVCLVSGEREMVRPQRRGSPWPWYER